MDPISSVWRAGIAVKGVGEAPVEAILEAREKGGPFKDLFDFCARVDLKRLNKRVTEKLIRSEGTRLNSSHAR